jgi:hypothetical protein
MTIGGRMAVGYFTEATQLRPAHEPGADVDCPVCVRPLDYPARSVKTISAMPAATRAISAYFRVHKPCWESLDEKEQGAWLATACKAAEEAILEPEGSGE